MVGVGGWSGRRQGGRHRGPCLRGISANPQLLPNVSHTHRSRSRTLTPPPPPLNPPFRPAPPRPPCIIPPPRPTPPVLRSGNTNTVALPATALPPLTLTAATWGGGVRQGGATREGGEMSALEGVLGRVRSLDLGRGDLAGGDGGKYRSKSTLKCFSTCRGNQGVRRGGSRGRMQEGGDMRQCETHSMRRRDANRKGERE